MPSVSETVQPRRSSADEAGLYIRHLILNGELTPGQRIPQDEIAKALGMSRIPIREALISLKSAGWVSIVLHRGAFVNVLDEQAVRDHFDLYGLMYGFAARRAMPRAGPELVQRLETLAEAVGRSVDHDEVFRLAVEFHGELLNAARSPRVAVVLRAMSQIVPGNFFSYVPGAVEATHRGLSSIAKAVAAGDAEGATEAYARMMTVQADQVIQMLRERGIM